MARVLLEEVGKTYGRTASEQRERAVDGVSFEVQDREFLVLVGPSGCGKTTTLRMIAGLETCSSGQIQIGDRVVNAVPPKDRDIAMVFQNYALYPHMTVYKNMAFGLELRYGGGWLARVLRRVIQPRRAAELEEKRRDISRRVQQAARTLGIERLLKRKPHQLSGGERQRVALGRSIVREPAAFLFDEPLSNLDARLRTEMRVELKRLHRQLGATMIYVTHDQVEALTLGDRVAVMRGGKLLQVGPPMEVYDEPADTFVARFIGSPGMNLAEGELLEENGQWSFRVGNQSIDLGREYMNEPLRQELQSHIGRTMQIGIRPEDIEMEEDSTDATRLVNRAELVEKAGESRRDAGVISGQVVAVDRLGDSAMLYLTLHESAAGQAMEDPHSELGRQGSQDVAQTDELSGSAAIETGEPQPRPQFEDTTKNDVQRHLDSKGDCSGQEITVRSSDRSSDGQVPIEWVVKTNRRIDDLSGRMLRLRMDLSRVHFFDATSGINLLKAGRK